MKCKLSLCLIALTLLGGCKTNKKVADVNSLPLCETHWDLISIEGQSIDEKTFTTNPYIIFDTLGKYTGNLGCNIFFGTYFQKKQKIELEYGGATKRLCPKMDLENKFLNTLKKDISNYSIEGKTLILYAGKTEIAKFEGKQE